MRQLALLSPSLSLHAADDASTMDNCTANASDLKHRAGALGRPSRGRL